MNNEKTPDMFAIFLGLLNLSGFGLGYLFQKLWVRWGIHLSITLALLAAAMLTNASKLPILWIAIFSLWLLWMAFDSWRQSRKFTAEQGLFRINLPDKWGWLLIALPVLLLGLEGVGLAGYGISGQKEFQRGLEAYYEVDCETAIEHFNQVTTLYELTLSSNPSSADAYLQVCDMLLPAEHAYEEGNYEDAIQLYQEFLGVYAEKHLISHAQDIQAKSYFEWASDLRKDQYYQEAINKYSVILEEYPNSQSASQVAAPLAESHLMLSTQLWKAKDYQEAIQQARIPLEEYPNTPSGNEAPDQLAQIYYDWAVDLKSQGRFAESVENILTVLDEFPDTEAGISASTLSAEIYYDWAAYLLETGAYQDSIAKFEIILNQYSAVLQKKTIEGDINTAYLEWAANLRSMGSYQIAITRYQTLLEEYPGTTTPTKISALILETHLEWGDHLFEKTEFSKAMDKFTEVNELTTDPDFIQAAENGYEKALWGLSQDDGPAGDQIVKDTYASACNGDPALSPAIGLAEEEPGKALSCRSGFTLTLPQDLKAAYPGHFQFVVSREEGTKTVQTCKYQSGYSVVRQQNYWTVTVRSTITGRVYSSKTFYGSQPEKCDTVEIFFSSVKYKTGSTPSLADVIAWLEMLFR